MKKVHVNSKGFTLIELLAIIVILGIIATITIPSIFNILENNRIKTEKNNAIILINAADLYFIENFEPNGYINSVGLPTLINEGYLDDENLVNDTFWIAEAKPSWICGKAVTKKNEVEFRKASIEMINNSGKSTKVGTEGCGDLPAISGD